MPPPRITLIIGCTASGKGRLGLELARRTGGEIVSIDSMKVYRRMDIGTAKPPIDTRREVPHHLIDVVEPSEDFSAAKYVALADQAISDIRSRGRPVFVVGGTPLYIKALTEGMFEGPSADPALRARLHELSERAGLDSLHAQLAEIDPTAAARIHRNDLRRMVRALEVFELTGKPISALQEQWDRERTRYDCSFIGLRWSREDQAHRINERVRRMIDSGLVDEVRALLEESTPLSETARKALGYAEMIDHLQGRCTLAEAVEMIKINTRRFAKSQRTWLKRFTQTHWIDLTPEVKAPELADELMQRMGHLWSP